jgi:hypothetical protein
MKNLLLTVCITALGICSLTNVAQAMDGEQDEQQPHQIVPVNSKPIILEVSNSVSIDQKLFLGSLHSKKIYHLVVSAFETKLYYFGSDAVPYVNKNKICANSCWVRTYHEDKNVGVHTIKLTDRLPLIDDCSLGTAIAKITEVPLKRLSEYFKDAYLKFRILTIKDDGCTLNDLLPELNDLLLRTLMSVMVYFDDLEECKSQTLYEGFPHNRGLLK